MWAASMGSLTEAWENWRDHTDLWTYRFARRPRALDRTRARHPVRARGHGDEGPEDARVSEGQSQRQGADAGRRRLQAVRIDGDQPLSRQALQQGRLLAVEPRGPGT